MSFRTDKTVCLKNHSVQCVCERIYIITTIIIKIIIIIMVTATSRTRLAFHYNAHASVCMCVCVNAQWRDSSICHRTTWECAELSPFWIHGLYRDIGYRKATRNPVLLILFFSIFTPSQRPRSRTTRLAVHAAERYRYGRRLNSGCCNRCTDGAGLD